MDGKKIIFIGNSYTYYGQTVFEKSQTNLTQKSRTDDKGYFYNLCRLNGADVEVTNWTFGGHNLEHLFGGNCTANRGCDGEDHKAYLVDPYYDYVVVQPGSGVASSARFLEDMEGIMSFFKAANPQVKFAVLVPYSAYGTMGSVIHLAKEFLDGLKAVDAMGVTVVDWGGLVMDILTGRVTVPNSTLSYTKNSFVICKSAKDGYHPNQLSGYITTLMTYCALTGTSALGQDYAFCNDTSLRPANTSSKFYDFETFISTYYTYNNATTNYPEIFASDADMRGIQSLIDAHLAARAYLNYNYSAPEADGDGNTGDSSGGDTAEEYVAKVACGGKESYLTKEQLQEKIVSGYTNGDYITLLTDVTCKGATSSNMRKSKTVNVTFDLSGRTLTLTTGSIMRTTYKGGYKSTFNLISSNGKGTLTLAENNTYTAFQAYGNHKVITVGTEIGYTDGDVVVINARRLLYISTYYDNDGSTSSFTFFGGEYNQTDSASGAPGFVVTAGKYNEGYATNYFAGKINFISAKINQKTESSYPLFTTTLTDAAASPETCPTVPGIILVDCEVNGYFASSVIHNMETKNALITYSGCKIFGDIANVGAEATDAGLGKVLLCGGTHFTLSDEGILKEYDKASIETNDGSCSGIYLDESGSTSPKEDA
ncbi:MAG: hypothetical protein IJ459_06355 [Clostridia bacterium]|nr:hypothetical protein [Clostridia bacterium]